MNMRSTGRRERHRNADRRALLEAAERVFARDGFAGASMRGIAAEAGISVGGVYQFFPGKDTLTHDGEAPIKADAQGAYPVPVPGQWSEI